MPTSPPSHHSLPQVKIFTADIIYHLFDQFTAYMKQIKSAEQEAARLEAVFPCVLQVRCGVVSSSPPSLSHLACLHCTLPPPAPPAHTPAPYHSTTLMHLLTQILPTCVFNKKDPIVVGIDVVEGIARVGAPLCVPTQVCRAWHML